ncbi:hypothetical protein J437_LFUL009593 [Ladona fulva]|uniref:Uncharacterized protein n=1 Tax=Ladona fulva TaxID=123851 RepID=A0A8K0K7T9_LADFU|nr:hypothetical protein J437_LFUL009593 [Ladona fulva]
MGKIFGRMIGRHSRITSLESLRGEFWWMVFVMNQLLQDRKEETSMGDINATVTVRIGYFSHASSLAYKPVFIATHSYANRSILLGVLMGAAIPKLAFDSRCGTNVALVSNGSTMVKLNSLEKHFFVVFDGKDIWQNDRNDRKTFPGYCTEIFKAGDTVGVKVTNTRAIHFYRNCEDLGPAASNAPENIYGAFEIRKNVTRITIFEQEALP